MEIMGIAFVSVFEEDGFAHIMISVEWSDKYMSKRAYSSPFTTVTVDLEGNVIEEKSKGLGIDSEGEQTFDSLSQTEEEQVFQYVKDNKTLIQDAIQTGLNM
ncbi:hypothetical protein [Bacillus thuringiensis]|uniref:hypothetical protein n=1 Tax=Bacillus thuringiensis TaxID=1428 RepID=UPI0021B3BF71|nr:hypothetical protein [Bacillus thuringiensis]